MRLGIAGRVAAHTVACEHDMHLLTKAGVQTSRDGQTAGTGHLGQLLSGAGWAGHRQRPGRVGRTGDGDELLVGKDGPLTFK